jgi:lysozyme family protein
MIAFSIKKDCLIRVFDIPASERDEIYRTEYWNAVNGDALRPGENLCVFDLAVNSGPHRALQIWNQAGGAQDGLRPADRPR